MPFHLAIFVMNKAGNVIANHTNYRHWYMAGHSLGGAMAGNYAAEHMDRFDGTIFLAAYPTKSLKKDGFKALSLYGSEDGILNRDHYKDSLSYMPDDFTEIVKRTGPFDVEEGCLSLAGTRKAKRYREIELEYQDMDFKKHRQKYSGWTAQIIQHECDHLQGIII